MSYLTLLFHVLEDHGVWLECLTVHSTAGNFMLVRDHDRSPLKAIDFGLAVRFDSATEPRSDLGLEGTPW